MIDLVKDLLIQCDHCREICRINKGRVHVASFPATEINFGTGNEEIYFVQEPVTCEHCGAEMSVSITSFEYPTGEFGGHGTPSIEGGKYMEKPVMGTIYDCEIFDMDPKKAYNEQERMREMILAANREQEAVNEVPTVEIETLASQVLKKEGYEMDLIQLSGEESSDILAARYRTGQLIVLYVECRRYMAEGRLTTGIVNSALGVQTDQASGNSLTVSTMYYTKEEQLLAREENFLIGGYDIELFRELLDRAKKHRSIM